MTTIDELGQRAAAAAHAEATGMAAMRVETGLERLRLGDAPVVPARRPGANPRRWVMLGAAVTLTAAAIVALAINANEGESHRVVPGVRSTQVTTGPTPVASTSIASTDVPSPTEVAIVTPADAIAVSHDVLPPAYPATPLASVDAPADPTRLPLVAIGDTRIVTVDTDGSTATLIDLLSPGVAPPQHLPLAATLAGTDLVAGPGDVLYGVVQGDNPLMSVVAIALSGDRAGQVIATAPIDAVAFVEAPRGVLGHGPDGIIDRRTGETLLGYVDETGAPTSLGRESHAVATIAGDVANEDMDLVLRDPDGTHDWHVVIDRSSDSPHLPGTFGTPAAPSSHGGAIVWTAVGPPEDPTSDVPSPTEPVIAVLAADGTGSWYSLTDGWQVAATDIDGTILMRRVDNQVELARLDPPQRFDFVNQPAAAHQRAQFASTLPTTLTTAAPCTANDLEVVPSSDGAMGTTYGVLLVRNRSRSDQPCQVSGVPDVALVDDRGNVVQSIDPALLADTSAQAIVLEPDSWATAQLGPISNICGGNESSQFRLTIGGQSIAVPFPVGGPFDPLSCDPSSNTLPGPGSLTSQAFAAVEPNPDQPGTFDNLTVTLEAPPIVRAGDVLRYDLVVANVSSPQVISDYCPIYTETLGAATGEFLLNCTGSEGGILISTGESVRFHIELQIPANAATGPATLTWTPVEPGGPPVTATVTVTVVA